MQNGHGSVGHLGVVCRKGTIAPGRGGFPPEAAMWTVSAQRTQRLELKWLRFELKWLRRLSWLLNQEQHVTINSAD